MVTNTDAPVTVPLPTQSPQGVTVLDPLAKSRLSKLLSCPPDQLSTTTLTDVSAPFFSAVLEYAALYSVISSTSSSSSPSHLRVTHAAKMDVNEDNYNQLDEIQHEHEPQHSSSRAASGSSFRRWTRRYRRAATSRLFGEKNHDLNDSLAPGTGARKIKRVHVPGIGTDLGDTVIVWPPPKNMCAKELMKRSGCIDSKNGKDHYLYVADKVYSGQVNFDDDDDDERSDNIVNGVNISDIKDEPSQNTTATKDSNKVDAAHVGNTTEQQKEAEAENEEEKEKEEEEEEEEEEEDDDDGIETFSDVPSITIALSMCAVGDPMCDLGRTMQHKELTLAIRGSAQPLYTFLRGVVSWRERFSRWTFESSSFEVFRYCLKSHCSSGDWESDGYQRSRIPSSVVLSQGQLEDIFKDAHAFFSRDTRAWYRRHGIPHRRSYLFHGPPGTGKTSTIRVLAGELQLVCCFLQFPGQQFNNQMLTDAFRHVPKNALLVIEDVDSLFNENRESRMEAASLTFSGLLNALDGIVSCDGLLTVLTTNHVKKLDTALVRSGRIDRAFLFDTPGKTEVGRYFKSFYPEAKQSVVNEFVEKVWNRREVEKARNISTLQQLFIAHRLSTDIECVKGIDDFFDAYFKMNLGNEERAQYVI